MLATYRQFDKDLGVQASTCNRNKPPCPLVRSTLDQARCLSPQWIPAQKVLCPGASLPYARNPLACAAARTRSSYAQGSRRPQRPADKSNLQIRISEISERAEPIYDGQHLVGVEKRTDRSYRGNIRLEPATKAYRLQVSTDIEAAVVYDLARMVLLGPEYSYNFPPDLYTAEDIAMMKRDIAIKYRNESRAIIANRNQHPRLTYQILAAGRSADAAVAAVAAAAADSAAMPVKGRPRRGVRIDPKLGSTSYYVTVPEEVEPHTGEQKTSSSPIQKIHHTKTYKSLEEAAIAYDVMRQALRRSAVNFPAQLSAAGVLAMKAWMDLNRVRLTGQPALSRRRRRQTTAAENGRE